MLRGFRCVFVALVGFALVGASPSPKGAAQAQQTASQNAVGELAASAATALPEKQVSPSPDHGCQRGTDNRQSNLCAYWKAADAAYDAARWGWWQLIIGVVGLVLGAATMAAAIAAAVYAKRAAVATERTVQIAEEAADGASEALSIAERNANAAADQVRVSEETARRQLRAYVGIEKVYVENIVIGMVPSANLNLKNFGQTPAYEYDVFSFCMVGPKSLDEACFDLPDDLTIN